MNWNIIEPDFEFGTEIISKDFNCCPFIPLKTFSLWAILGQFQVDVGYFPFFGWVWVFPGAEMDTKWPTDFLHRRSKVMRMDDHESDGLKANHSAFQVKLNGPGMVH